jgi:hypothetical protein
METIVLTDKKQMFNGVTYYLCGKYFQKNGIRLHRVVWEYHNGEIPEGYHVRAQGEEVPIEKWYFVRGDDNPRLRESLNDGLDYNIVIAIED